MNQVHEHDTSARSVGTADGLADLVELLPHEVADRVAGLGQCLCRRPDCPVCRPVVDVLQTAALCARYGEPAEARRMIEEALATVTEPGHRHLRTNKLPSGGRHGHVRRWAGYTQPLTAATDASWKNRAGGYAYVVSDGRWGPRSRVADRRDPTGPARVLVNELRAVELLLSRLDVNTGLLLLLDSRDALSFLGRWQQGRIGELPPGYNLRPRARGVEPTLVRLASRVTRMPGLSFQHVKGHRGHLLNEAADSLSSMARRHTAERFDVADRAHDLVDAFLRDWHTATRQSPHR